MPKFCESEEQQQRWPPTDVTSGTAEGRLVAEKEEHPRSGSEFSTVVRSGVRNPSSERCVSSVPSVVALRKRTRALRSDQLRTSEWRTLVLRKVEFAYPPASPKDTLVRVFEHMKRAARAKKSARISGRLAPKIPRSASRRVTVRVEPMHEESTWRSLHDVVGAVLQAARNGGLASGK